MIAVGRSWPLSFALAAFPPPPVHPEGSGEATAASSGREDVCAAPSQRDAGTPEEWPDAASTQSAPESPRWPSFTAPGPSLEDEALKCDGLAHAVPEMGRCRTTVMMRNIPHVLTRGEVLDILVAEGFVGAFDFFYMPIDFRTGSNAGFAFVNLTSAAGARQFRTHFHRFSRWGVRSAKLCNVSWARDDQQGLHANVRRYRNSPVMHRSVAEEHRPLLLVDGVPARFPRPTRRPWTPDAHYGARTVWEGPEAWAAPL